MLMVFFAILVGCSTTRRSATIPEDKPYLLARYKIIPDRQKINPRNLSGFVQQKPNNKFLGLVRLNTWFYKVGSKGKNTKFRQWMRRIGEEPVMLDTTLASASCEDMILYLNNTGYFYSEADYSVKYRKKKAIVHYKLHTVTPYRYREINYTVEGDKVERIIRDNLGKSLIGEGDIYNVYTLDDERDRLTRILRNNGYYFFSKDFVSYQIDSSLNSKQMDVDVVVENVKRVVDGYPDSVIRIPHKPYYINDIFIHTELDPVGHTSSEPDTLTYYTGRKKDDSTSVYHLIYYDELKIKPQVMSQSIYFTKGDLYRLKDISETNRKLSSYMITRMVNINLDETPDQEIGISDTAGLLDCNILMNRSPVNAFSVETDITNSAGNPGMAASVVYQNKNIFRGAEVFRIKVRGALELQTSGKSTERFFFFNTAETGFEASLQFPRFLVPLRPERFPKFFKPATSFITSLNWQLRPDYSRYQVQGSFGYNWDPSERIHHALFPVDIQSVKIFPDDSSAFFKYIYESGDIRLKEQYTDHLIMSLRYNYIYSTQRLNRPVNFIYLNFEAQSAGNLLNAAANILKTTRNADGKYTIFEIPFSQYIRTDIDIRYYNYLDKDNVMVFRGLLGIGLPYGNSEALPYEKGFFAGGANDMRGWEYRRLGPGSFNQDTANVIDRMGDLKILGNIEYRFPIYRSFKGSLFVDMGNIWLLNKTDEWPGGEFAFSRFIDEVAINTGIGFRFDFNFFIFRIDLATAVRDPAFPENDRLVLFTRDAKTLWNFGIGYPF